MKLFNFLKKETKTTAKSNIQKLDKNQLNKVIGGRDDSASTDPKLSPLIGGVVIDKILK